MSQTQIGLELRTAKGDAIAPPLLRLIDASYEIRFKDTAQRTIRFRTVRFS